jgi:hypothetical protein
MVRDTDFRQDKNRDKEDTGEGKGDTAADRVGKESSNTTERNNREESSSPPHMPELIRNTRGSPRPPADPVKSFCARRATSESKELRTEFNLAWVS